jgi:biotin carboxyl carrier protein
MELIARAGAGPQAGLEGGRASAAAPAVRVSVRAVGGKSGLFEITIDSRTYLVNALRVGGGRPLAPAIEPGGGSRLVLVYSLLVDGAQAEVAVSPRRGGGAAAGTLGGSAGSYWVSGRQGGKLVEIADPLSYLAAQSAGAAGATGTKRSRRVLAYMPGRVVEILVAEGEAVVAGQGVLVLEAMKMQNEIQAEHDGTVRRLLVEAGQSVDGGDPLFELE